MSNSESQSAIWPQATQQRLVTPGEWHNDRPQGEAHVAIPHQDQSVKTAESHGRRAQELVRIEQLRRAHPRATQPCAEEQSPRDRSP